MQVKPLHDRILVKRLSEEEKTKGGIIIPDTAKEKPAEGQVMAVGAGRRTEGAHAEKHLGRTHPDRKRSADHDSLDHKAA
mgnify:CR=1 FL=1